jgi:hypothetical protein
MVPTPVSHSFRVHGRSEATCWIVVALCFSRGEIHGKNEKKKEKEMLESFMTHPPCFKHSPAVWLLLLGYYLILFFSGC